MDQFENERDVADVGIGYWQNEKPEIDCHGKPITGRILALGEIIEDSMNNALRGHGLRYSTYAIIATLRAVGPPYQMTPTQLQNTLLVSSGGISNLIRRIEGEGLVIRETDPSDGRGVLVSLTEKGIQLADQTMPLQAAAERHLVRMFAEDERAIITKLLRRMLLMNMHAPL